MWICNICKKENDAENNYCEMCGTARPQSSHGNGEGKKKYDSGADLYHEAGHESAHTDNGEDKSDFGIWKCKCGQINQNDYLYCINCGSKKPTKTVGDSVASDNEVATVIYPMRKKPTKTMEDSVGSGGGEKEPPNKTLIICITAVLIALIFLAAVIISAKSNSKAQSPYHSANVQPPYPSPIQSVNVEKTDEEEWGAWSEWSTTPRTASSTVQVEQRQNERVIGYYMVHYGTQEAKAPHYRMFRNYSIKDDLERYGARSSYGEKQLTKYITISELSNAVAYPANGEKVTIIYGGETYSGYQMGTSTAYNFGDDQYVWFIESEDTQTVTEYRYRERR